jgi:hypothetical protein
MSMRDDEVEIVNQAIHLIHIFVRLVMEVLRSPV